jgi:hypothetical protein
MSDHSVDGSFEATLKPEHSNADIDQLCRNCESACRSFTRVCEKCDLIDFETLMNKTLVRSTRGNVKYLKMADPHHDRQHLPFGSWNPVCVWTEAKQDESPTCPLCEAARYLSKLVHTLETLSKNEVIVSLEESCLAWLTRRRLLPLVRMNMVPRNSDMSYKWWNFDFVPIAKETFGCARRVNTKEFSIDLMSHWINVCSSTHGNDCNHPSFQSQTPFGTIRVIDVADLCLVDAPFDCKYFALSYVWGKGKQTRLSIESLVEWQIPGSFERVKMARTIADAISLTRKLNYRYLWVDSLCIIHDSTQDRTQQIQEMYRIYDQAFLTIVVASGDDCEAGIPGLRPDVPRACFQAFIHVDDVDYASILDDVSRFLNNTTWNLRGWTFQEMFCSRRTLIFTDYIAAYSCPVAAWREDWCLEPKRFEDSFTSNDPVVLDISRRLVGYPPIDDLFVNGANGTILAEDNYDQLHNVVFSYLLRKLTDESDILNAFEGIAQKMMPTFGPFLYGLPERTLGQGINWSGKFCTERRLGFPSWTWAGWYFGNDTGARSRETMFKFHSTTVNMSIVGQLLNIFSLCGGIHLISPQSQTPDHRFYTGSKFEAESELLAQHIMMHNLDVSDTSPLITFKSSAVEVRLVPSPYSAKQNQGFDLFVLHPPPEATLSIGMPQLHMSIFERISIDLTAPHELFIVSMSSGIVNAILIQWHGSIAHRVSPEVFIFQAEWWWSWAPEMKIIVLG